MTNTTPAERRAAALCRDFGDTAGIMYDTVERLDALVSTLTEQINTLTTANEELTGQVEDLTTELESLR